MRFVRSATSAGELRGEAIARAIGAPCSLTLEDARAGEWVIFVKTSDGIEAAKNAGCMVAFDPVDMFCYPDRDIGAWPEADIVIVPSKVAARYYKPAFPRADFLLIPHQWDDRISGEADHDEFRPGYVGRKFNLREHLHIPMVTEPDAQLAALPLFNAHVAAHDNKLSATFKPATKVASAAAVGAVIVTQRSAAACELLGEHYQFYAEGTLFDGLYNAKRKFGTAQWQDARDIMASVKERTSMRAVAEQYRVFQ